MTDPKQLRALVALAIVVSLGLYPAALNGQDKTPPKIPTLPAFLRDDDDADEGSRHDEDARRERQDRQERHDLERHRDILRAVRLPDADIDARNGGRRTRHLRQQRHQAEGEESAQGKDTFPTDQE